LRGFDRDLLRTDFFIDHLFDYIADQQYSSLAVTSRVGKTDGQ